jgi:hypothetical protein
MFGSQASPPDQMFGSQASPPDQMFGSQASPKCVHSGVAVQMPVVHDVAGRTNAPPTLLP